MVTDKWMRYHETLQILGITTLETQRLRGDLTEVVFMGLEDIDYFLHSVSVRTTFSSISFL